MLTIVIDTTRRSQVKTSKYMGLKIPIPNISGPLFIMALRKSYQKPLIVEFGSTHCGACKDLMFTLEKFQFRHDVHTGFVDISQNPDLCEMYDIDHYPTTIIFHKGRQLGYRHGNMSYDRLAKFLSTTSY